MISTSNLLNNLSQDTSKSTRLRIAVTGNGNPLLPYSRALDMLDTAFQFGHSLEKIILPLIAFVISYTLLLESGTPPFFKERL
ncbi:MAG: hypothetical protein CVU64_04410 [Deltaproteobacteria bacterium HGW-Deltaproteobacteria-21]|jgi:hypothetical protein|nr:MAG: hypothetical protein CVU64_04410 [Deltaproteobacteria bacterium HGW-Deltaproteobacteria-21]